VVAVTRRAKRSEQPAGSRLVMNAVGRWAPAFLHARFAHFAYRGKWFNLIVSNLRGPTSPRSLLGARVIAAYPIVPLAEDVGLALAAMSWGDVLTLGLTADPFLVPDLEGLAASVVSAFELLAQTEAEPRPVVRRPAVSGATPR
jgi:hypothetical protein